MSLALQDEREQDLIHMGKSAKEIESDKETALFKSCAFQIARVYGVKCRRYIMDDRAPSSAELGGAGNIKSEAARAKFAYNNNRSPTTNILVRIMLV